MVLQIQALVLLATEVKAVMSEGFLGRNMHVTLGAFEHGLGVLTAAVGAGVVAAACL